MSTLIPKLILGSIKSHVYMRMGRRQTYRPPAEAARYCYSVWFRHLVMAGQNGLNTQPRAVAELGPGRSLGVGLAALLSGAEKYYAFDVVRFAASEQDLLVLDELVALFRRREAIPGDDAFPALKPRLDSYDFPHALLGEERLCSALDETRVRRIRASRARAEGDSMIRYFVPWNDASVIRPGSVDLIYSQAVLEHIEDLPGAYRAMYQWVRRDGFLSHQIVFSAHGMSDRWNAQWTYSPLAWKLMVGLRPYSLNRQPHSKHLELLLNSGFEVLCDKPIRRPSTVRSRQLAKGFRDLSEEDLTTSGAFIQARRA